MLLLTYIIVENMSVMGNQKYLFDSLLDLRNQFDVFAERIIPMFIDTGTHSSRV